MPNVEWNQLKQEQENYLHEQQVGVAQNYRAIFNHPAVRNALELDDVEVGTFTS